MFYDMYDGVKIFFGGKKIIKKKKTGTISIGLSSRKVESSKKTQPE
jgi:hypothetical protein